INQLLNQQTQRAELQQKSSTQLTQKSSHQRTNQPLKRYQFGVYTMQVNTEIECQYDSFDFKLLPLDIAI
ncbi:hypothetical protein ACSTK8_25205, partial [Vibrio parahaemolyticus]